MSVRQSTNSSSGASRTVRSTALLLVLRSVAEVLGVAQQDPEAFLQGGQADDEVAHIEALIAKRNEARASKDWAAADEARDALNALGVVLEDSAGKTTWRKA